MLFSSHKLDIEQINVFQNFDIPEHIAALDARLREGLNEEQLGDLEYQLSVVYTLDNASKSKAAIKFLQPDSEEAKDVKNVLLKYKIADEDYPYKPGTVVKLVARSTRKAFLLSHHTQAWHLYKVRPKKGVTYNQQTLTRTIAFITPLTRITRIQKNGSHFSTKKSRLRVSFPKSKP